MWWWVHRSIFIFYISLIRFDFTSSMRQFSTRYHYIIIIIQTSPSARRMHYRGHACILYYYISRHELVFYKLTLIGSVLVCILYIICYGLVVSARDYALLFFTAIITMYRLFCRFDLRNPARPWSVRKYVRGANTNDHYYYHESRRTRFRQSTRHIVTLYIIILRIYILFFFFVG